VSPLRSLLTTGVLALAIPGLVPAGASAAVTIGQSPPGAGTLGPCLAGFSTVQTAVGTGTSYEVPAGGGVITEWRHQSTLLATGSLAFRVFRQPQAGQFTALTDEEHPIAPGVLNLFPTRIPVLGGEAIGLRTPNNFDGCLASNTMQPADQRFFKSPAPAVGTQIAYTQDLVSRLNVAATLEADADKDGYGDESQDSCAGDALTQAACTVTIDKKPKRRTSSAKARLRFSVPDPDAKLECRIDKKPFKKCSSPLKLRRLKPRRHFFRVHALDLSGAAGTNAQARWRVVG
jgi:hypothetical protein